MSPRWSWTQPICPDCYELRHPGREPSKLINPDPELCVDCAKQTWAGIYVRIDPAEARHPTLEKS